MILDIYRLGIGPSSSHTVGPMRAALLVRKDLARQDASHLRVELFGSLALTGRGHSTDAALMYGLLGHAPETVELAAARQDVLELRRSGGLRVGGRSIRFAPERDILWNGGQMLPGHPNGMTFHIGMSDGSARSRTFYSVGGGTVQEEGAPGPEANPGPTPPYAYDSMREAVEIADCHGLSLAEIAYTNECTGVRSADVDAHLDNVWAEMRACIDRGLHAEGALPGSLGVQRRAKGLHGRLLAAARAGKLSNRSDFASAYAIAVNEENAAGHRVVTAPTNGAAGVVPAVLRYFCESAADPAPRAARTFLLTAALVGDVVRRRASISGAQVGCQGEVGTASAMAAAGLAAASGASNRQVEAAAEIALEHHLGMSCDPVQGLVQIPCIERNAMGAVKAINACTLAMNGDGHGVVSFDEAVAAMRETGLHMDARYKETALGGLAVKVLRLHPASQ